MEVGLSRFPGGLATAGTPTDLPLGPRGEPRAPSLPHAAHLQRGHKPWVRARLPQVCEDTAPADRCSEQGWPGTRTALPPTKLHLLSAPHSARG